MELIFILVATLQLMGVSLGVGSSTLAVTNFFYAIWDGTIDPKERAMMGVVYIVLRVAMGVILITTIVRYLLVEGGGGLSQPVSYQYIVWVLILVLYVNAILMTYCRMPISLGPAFQASSWYTLGITTALLASGVVLSFTHYLLFYAGMIIAALVFLNSLMRYCKHCQDKRGVCLPD